MPAPAGLIGPLRPRAPTQPGRSGRASWPGPGADGRCSGHASRASIRWPVFGPAGALRYPPPGGALRHRDVGARSTPVPPKPARRRHTLIACGTGRRNARRSRMDDARTRSAREAAWWALHDALRAGWRVGELTFDPAAGLHVLAAMSPRPPGRGRGPGRVEVVRGVDELATVRALAERLRGPPSDRRRVSDAGHRCAIDRSLVETESVDRPPATGSLAIGWAGPSQGSPLRLLRSGGRRPAFPVNVFARADRRIGRTRSRNTYPTLRGRCADRDGDRSTGRPGPTDRAVT